VTDSKPSYIALSDIYERQKCHHTVEHNSEEFHSVHQRITTLPHFQVKIWMNGALLRKALFGFRFGKLKSILINPTLDFIQAPLEQSFYLSSVLDRLLGNVTLWFRDFSAKLKLSNDCNNGRTHKFPSPSKQKIKTFGTYLGIFLRKPSYLDSILLCIASEN
jgi:hypothetical protein